MYSISTSAPCLCCSLRHQRQQHPQRRRQMHWISCARSLQGTRLAATRGSMLMASACAAWSTAARWAPYGKKSECFCCFFGQ